MDARVDVELCEHSEFERDWGIPFQLRVRVKPTPPKRRDYRDKETQ